MPQRSGAGRWILLKDRFHAGELIAREMALDEVPFGEFDLWRHHRLAEVACDKALAVAAGLERATWRRIDRRWNVALQHDALLLHRDIGDRHGRQKRLRIGMIGR